MVAMQKNGCRARDTISCFINNHPITLQKKNTGCKCKCLKNGLKILSETQRHILGKKYKLFV